ncbi:transposase, partial [bacterium]|nr:transposase [bacterium]
LSLDRSCWIRCKQSGFFLSVAVLSKLFRGKFLSYLKCAFQQDQLQFHGKLQHLNHPAAFNHYLKRCYQINWIVYSKPPFAGPQHLLQYLGRYTHRIAISNDRLLALRDGKVSFQWKNYKQGNQQQTMTLNAEEFIRRFLLHILPDRFVRIRHYGLLANPKRQANLVLCRLLLNASTPNLPQQNWMQRYQSLTGKDFDLCPACGKGRMICIETIFPCNYNDSS